CDSAPNIKDLEKLRVRLRGGKTIYELSDRLFLCIRGWQCLHAVQSQTALAAFANRALVEEGGSFAILQCGQQRIHETATGITLNPEGLAVDQSATVGIQTALADGQGFSVCRVERLSAALDAGEQANHVPIDGSKGSLVVVVDVKIDKPVVTLVAAKILEVQVAAAPSQRRIAEQGRIWQVVVKQVPGTAKEDEGTLLHLCVLHGQALWIAPRVAAEYRVDDVGGTLAGLVAHWGADRGVNRTIKIGIFASATLSNWSLFLKVRSWPIARIDLTRPLLR